MLRTKMKYKDTVIFGSYEGYSIFSVGQTRGKFTDIDFYLDPERNLLLHINSRAGIVFLAQPVDFVHVNCETNKQKKNYVNSYQGFLHGVADALKTYRVYADERHTCYLEKDHTLCILDSTSCKLIEAMDMQYTEHDTLQSVFDRARVAARCFILATDKRRRNERKNLPMVSKIN